MMEEPTKTTTHDVRSLQEYDESGHTIQRTELRRGPEHDRPPGTSGGGCGCGAVDGSPPPPQPPPPHTGVAHFRHVNDPNLRTFLFSSGRHSERGVNTYVTVDFSKQDDPDGDRDENPFVGAVERPLVVADDEYSTGASASASCCTWVSAATTVTTSTTSSDDGVATTAPTHYALFSGGSIFDSNTHRPVDVGPSRLYSFHEDEDGSLLQPARLVWVEDIPGETSEGTTSVGGFDFMDESSSDVTGAINPDGRGARFGLLADLGDIYNSDGTQVSFRGEIDIVVSGTRGVQIYSRKKGLGPGKGGNSDKWERIRSTPLLGMTSTAYVGVCHYKPPRDTQHGYLLVSNRSYNQTDEYFGKKLDAPCLVYDYRNDRVVQEFASQGQIESITSLDGGSKVLVGAGGEAGIRGQPNLSYDVIVGTDDGEESITLRLSDTQIVRGMPLEFGPMEGDDPTPLDATKYFGIPSPGNTKTRQVVAFRLFDDDMPDEDDDDYDSHSHSHDFVLEVNSAQPCCIYCRDGSSSSSSSSSGGGGGGGVAYRVIPLPGSEGTSERYARAGDVLCFRDAVYVILAMYNSSNLVYRLHPSSLKK